MGGENALGFVVAHQAMSEPLRWLAGCRRVTAQAGCHWLSRTSSNCTTTS
jgi:hypothetical protein